MPSSVLATISCVSIEFAGWIRPRRASRKRRSSPLRRKIPNPPATSSARSTIAPRRLDRVILGREDLRRPRRAVIDAVRPVLGDPLEMRFDGLERQPHLGRRDAEARRDTPSSATARATASSAPPRSSDRARGAPARSRRCRSPSTPTRRSPARTDRCPPRQPARRATMYRSGTKAPSSIVSWLAVARMPRTSQVSSIR